jgi:hypothetical protein
MVTSTVTYEVGKRVKNIHPKCKNYLKRGKVTTIMDGWVFVVYDDGYGGQSNNPSKYYELIDCGKTNNAMEKIMDITKAFVTAFLPEPEKSYRKAGITNGDGILTDQGGKIFLTYLLTKTPSFKADVVDGILQDLKDECK